jgi:hypothetical protein
MKKFVILFIFLFVFSQKVFAEDKIFKSVYAIYDMDKSKVSAVIDSYIKEKNYFEIQNYKELGCFNFALGEKKKDYFLVNTKQVRNDLFMIIKINRNRKSLRVKEDFLLYLKDHKVNFIEIESKRLSQNLEDDALYTLENGKNKWKDDVFDPNSYKISVERYVGYKKIIRKKHGFLFNTVKTAGNAVIFTGKTIYSKGKNVVSSVKSILHPLLHQGNNNNPCL